MLSAEAIGPANLEQIGQTISRHRVTGFLILAGLSAAILLISKILNILHLKESLIIILSLGILYDFAPRIISLIISRLNKGSLGLMGFGLFASGFSIQAYVTLSLLY